MRRTIGVILFALAVEITAMAQVGIAQPLQIAPDAQCPVCGMYPARYPKFNCEIIFQDGSYEALDSAQCLFIYLLFPEKINVRLKPVSRIYFKNYLNAKWLAAGKTFFVVGSTITGPMGPEFIAVDSVDTARLVKESGRGKEIIPYSKVTRSYMTKAAGKGWLHYLAKTIVLR